MTMVRVPSPPPLPVRQGTRIPGGGLSPMLSRLAAERATGVLMREGGMLHLSEGQVVYAESPATPGLDSLLIAHGVLDEEGWREALAQAGPQGLVGRFLVDSGRIVQGALELCHLGALFDAAYFVLGPSSAPARFRYGEAHWLGPVHPVPVTAVERETLRRRDLLHTIWPDPAIDEAPLVRADRPKVPTVTPRQEAVLGRVDGTQTAADISRALGRPAFHTLVDIRRLAAAGFVSPRIAAPTPAPAPAPALAPTPAPDGTPPAPTEELLPYQDPHITLLKRLRDALEAL
ncbi:transcriptional regulator [Streptomyces cynarae]|uniref:transcriptional regulator n=1 Tax=Streptomyces cynarae TaxID=2981134 RepID=UPI00406D4F1C